MSSYNFDLFKSLWVSRPWNPDIFRGRDPQCAYSHDSGDAIHGERAAKLATSLSRDGLRFSWTQNEESRGEIMDLARPEGTL